MKLKELLRDVDYQLIQGNLEVTVVDLAYDSRNVRDGCVFVALKGFRVDGHDYIGKAIELGCKVVIVSDDVMVPEDVTVIRLEDTRVDLSKLSRTFFGYPDKEMTLVAITGTKGKTTTSTMVQKILNDRGRVCGLIGTMGVFYLDKHYHTMNTSPESYDVFKYMREMLEHGVKYLVMEISSQSLKLKRWSNVIFDYGVFTNLSLDHVGECEHDSFEEYKYCKSLLFQQCRVGLFNLDSEYYKDMVEHATCQVLTFGKSSQADYCLLECHNLVKNGVAGIEMVMKKNHPIRYMVGIPGVFTAYNALVAIALCDLLGIEEETIRHSLETVKVKGRMENVNISSKFSVLIDYAYQGIAMENVLKTVRESYPKRIVNVFGCGGNRSRQRRLDCGEISGKYADLSILTADNPRYEDNQDIIEDILVGMRKTAGKYIIIDDRKEAIRYSIMNAKEGDVILILGKGHEDYQEINGVRYPFDERIVIREILNEMDDSEKLRLGILE